MKFWNKETILKALPKAKLFNMPDNFSANGVRVTSLDFSAGDIALVRKSDEKIGILETFFPRIEDKVSALLCTDAQHFEKYNLPVIEVENTSDAVIIMANYIRKYFKGKVIDITGSSGKTTTTKMCYDVLTDYGVSANLSRANTNFGIAWNMTHYDLAVPYWVNETSLGGGMDLNSYLTRPDIAVVTNIAPVHLKQHQQLINVAKAKSKIFTAMKPNGIAILYREMEYFDIFENAAKAKGLKIITFGESEDADVRILTGERNSINIFGKLYKYSDLPIPKHILLDAAITLTVVYCLQGNGNPIYVAINNLQGFTAIAGRGEVTKGRIDSQRQITIIDEAYNANPLSMKFALDGFNQIYGNNDNKLLILGDMTEGGPQTVQQHVSLLEDIKKVNPSRVILCGEQMSVLWDKVKDLYDGKYYKSVDELLAEFLIWVKNDDYIFIKSSHSVELFKVVIKLQDLIRNYN